MTKEEFMIQFCLHAATGSGVGKDVVRADDMVRDGEEVWKELVEKGYIKDE